MKRVEKDNLRAELHEIFRQNPNMLVISYLGFKVNDTATLRRRLRDARCGYRVVKNTLARRAAEGTPMAQVADMFEGTTALAYSPDDPVGLAKVLREFVRENKSLTFKAIIAEGKVFPGDSLEAVANMPTKEQLLAQLLFLLNHPVTSLARVLNATARDLAVVMKEVADQKGA